jgi:hypothetical protein
MNAITPITALDALKGQCRSFTDYEWLMLAGWALDQLSDRHCDAVGDDTYDGFAVAFERVGEDYPSRQLIWPGAKTHPHAFRDWREARDADLARRMVRS